MFCLHRGSHVVDRGGDAFFGAFDFRETSALQHGGQLFHLRRIGARAVQIGAAGAVDGAGVLAIERQNVAGPAGGVVEVDMGQALPAAANADDFAADFTSTVNHRFDHGIQSRNIAAARENADSFCSHEYPLTAPFRFESPIIIGGAAGGQKKCGGRELRTGKNCGACPLGRDGGSANAGGFGSAVYGSGSFLRRFCRTRMSVRACAAQAADAELAWRLQTLAAANATENVRTPAWRRHPCTRNCDCAVRH